MELLENDGLRYQIAVSGYHIPARSDHGIRRLWYEFIGYRVHQRRARQNPPKFHVVDTETGSAFARFSTLGQAEAMVYRLNNRT